MKDELEAIRAQLARIESQHRPGVKKSESPSVRDWHRSKCHAEFKSGVEFLRDEEGWSMRRIAEKLDVHVTTLIAWYENGDKKRDQLPGWVLSAMPKIAQPAMMRVRLDWSDPPPVRTGTDG